MSNPTVTKFGVIFEDDEGVIVMKDFRIDADHATDCDEVIILNAVINRLLAERDEYTNKEEQP